jgi:hypothetical protein
VRAVAADLAAAGVLQVCQRGRPVPDPTAARGPVRYGRGPAFPDPPATRSDDALTARAPGSGRGPR